MNKVFRISALSVALCASLISQAQLRYGISVGGSFAHATLDDAPGLTMNNRSGFRGGLTLEYQMPSCGFAADISALYTRYNTRPHSDNEGTDHSFGRNFIEIPLHFKYKFWLPVTNNLAAPMIFTGPDLLINVDSSHDAALAQKRVQPGWNVGLGIDAANILQLTAGYRFGLGNAMDHSEFCPDGKLHTSGWFVSATILFDF